MARAGQLACLFEASAEKPGNISPRHDLRDTSFEDMLRSAVAIGPELALAGERGVGATVHAIVAASRREARGNTNLGIALLLAPLARAALSAHAGALRARVSAVLRSLTVEDARAAYAAIRMAAPGGLEERVPHDVREEPAIGLREAMQEAQHRDRIAAEYVTDFAATFEIGLPALREALAAGLPVRPAVVELQLRLLAVLPDTLIARKRGRAAAEAVSERARAVLEAGGVRTDDGRRRLASFDASLRKDGNALNPGATADVVAATLFVALLGGEV